MPDLRDLSTLKASLRTQKKSDKIQTRKRFSSTYPKTTQTNKISPPIIKPKPNEIQDKAQKCQ